MAGQGSEELGEALQRQRALSRWDSEGGAGPGETPAASPEGEGPPPFPKMGEAEFNALHVRVIALESLLIALLSAASDRELELAREMASYISPRLGFTPHPLTTHAADHARDLIERASRFRTRTAS